MTGLSALPTAVRRDSSACWVPNLENVGVYGDDVDLARLHHLGDDRQARRLAGLGQVLEPLEAEALESCRDWCGV